MSKISFFALGGLGEVGKNMYVLEINQDIFVLDCGSALPGGQVFGYDSIIPDFSYLLDNIDRVRGLFLSHFRQKNIGGFIRIAKDLKVPYYVSDYTFKAIESWYLPLMAQEEKEGLDFKIINKEDILEFGETKVEFFTLSSSVPDTFGFAFKVNVSEEEDKIIYKNIVYLPDFNFDQNLKRHFRINFKKINKIADEGVLVLLTPSSGANSVGHITTDDNLDAALHKLMAHQGRDYIIMDAENVSGMLQVIDAVEFQKRQITIIGAKARRLVEIAMELGYAVKDPQYYIEKQLLTDDIRNSQNTVIIIAGEQTEAFFALQRIATFQDPHYYLTANDNVTFLMSISKKYEKILASSWDNIWLNNTNLIDFDVNLMPETKCGPEDLKLLYSLMSPKYIIPISGDYRMLKAQEEIAKKYGFCEKHIIRLDNGLVATFENQDYILDYELIETGDILFGGESDSDINDYVAREREALTSEGFLVISGMINLKERKIYKDIEMVSYGFLPEFGQEEVIKEIKEKFKEIVNEYLEYKKVDYKELRQELKNEISKLITKITRKRPILIPAIIDISN
ncbi:ribonuclease J [bacterium]|nr:ribonuclease J [bacterium]